MFVTQAMAFHELCTYLNTSCMHSYSLWLCVLLMSSCFITTGPVFAKSGIIKVIFVLFNYYLNSFLASVATSRHSRDDIYSTCVRVISTTMCM